jgi:hypothetical protein
VTAALDAERTLSDADRAAVRVANALGNVPTTIDDDASTDLQRHFSEKDVEWVALAVAMMGFLNKAMDALGVPLEDPMVAEVNPVIAPSGWTPGQHSTATILDGDPPGEDSVLARLSVVRYAPAAIKLDKEWTKGVPARWPAVGEFLQRETGHSFPVLAHLQHRRAIRAIPTMIKEDLGESIIGHDQKLAAGLTYAKTVDNPALEREIRALGGTELPDSPSQTLARAISPSPAAVDQSATDSAPEIPPAGIVEIVSFVAVLQMPQRLSSFYPIPSDGD